MTLGLSLTVRIYHVFFIPRLSLIFTPVTDLLFCELIIQKITGKLTCNIKSPSSIIHKRFYRLPHLMVLLYSHAFVHHIQVYYQLTARPAPSWFNSSVGGALHCTEFKCHSIIFQSFNFMLYFHNCCISN